MANTIRLIGVLFCTQTKASHSIVFLLELVEMHEDSFSLKQGHKEMNNIPLEFLFLVFLVLSFFIKQ
jgi:hypothetical protein